MDLCKAVEYLHPGAKPQEHFLVQDDSDGRGPYIAQWHLDAAQPAAEELEAGWAAYQEATKWDGVRAQRAPLLERADIEFNKALDQGKDTKPISEYRQVLRDITKGADPALVVWPKTPWQ